MKLAVMQPYFFPYLPYWQLINAVDRFVIYDDVNFIKGGWVNRNRILVNGKPTFITVALRDASPNRSICDTQVHETAFRPERMLRTVSQAYRRSPYFDQIYPTIETIVQNADRNLSSFLDFSIRTACHLLGIQTKIVPSHGAYGNEALRGQARVLDICMKEGAAIYVNAQGGAKLYDPETFAAKGIDLRFLVMRPFIYKQRANVFDPFLSIIDPLMETGVDGVRSRLNDFDLVTTGVCNAH
jgi:hypothetical protein